jgi:murein L,D-transpeptidase YcbB/YkuD
MKAAINTGKTQTIKPQEYVPVYFTYQTIWVKDTQKGRQIFFSNDPYGLDARMVRMLKVS